MIRLTESTRIKLEGEIAGKLIGVSDQKIVDVANQLGMKLNLTPVDYEQMPLVGKAQ